MTKQRRSRELLVNALRAPGEHATSASDSRSSKLRILKFGGTSMGDAPAIARVVEITGAAAREGNALVVVSAMAGVTNRLLEAALEAQAGNFDSVQTILQELRAKHETALNALIRSQVE